jgi:hypothetical protein
MIEFLVSVAIIGLIVHGIWGGWVGYKEIEGHSNGNSGDNSSGDNSLEQPFYWMVIGDSVGSSRDGSDAKDSNYYDEGVDF